MQLQRSHNTAAAAEEAGVDVVLGADLDEAFDGALVRDEVDEDATAGLTDGDDEVTEAAPVLLPLLLLTSFDGMLTLVCFALESSVCSS